MAERSTEPDEDTAEQRESPSEALEEITLPHTSSNWKVLGEIGASDGIGVLGHATAESGVNRGVQGVSDSTDDGAAGVSAEAAGGSGDVFGVDAITQSSNIGAAAVRARAPNGGRALRAVADSQLALYATSVSNFAISGLSSSSYGGRFQTNSGPAGGYRIHASGSLTSAHGLRGRTYSAGDGSAGVYGEARQGSGVTYGVDGVTKSTDSGAAGVRGSTSGKNSGVVGRTYDDASNLPTLASFESAGVFGKTDKIDDFGVLGWSVNGTGMLGRSDSDGHPAILAFNSSSNGLGLSVRGGPAEIQNIPAGSGNNVGVNSSDLLVDTTASSVRYKTDVEPLDPDPETVLDLQPRRFDYESTGDSGIGYLAEEVDDVLPELVTYDDQGRPDGVRYDRLGLFLQAAVRQQRSRIEDVEDDYHDQADDVEELTDEVASLREENERLRAEIERLRDTLAGVEDRLADVEKTGSAPTGADD